MKQKMCTGKIATQRINQVVDMIIIGLLATKTKGRPVEFNMRQIHLYFP